MESRTIQLTLADIKNRKLNLKACGLDFFPPGILGGSTKANAGTQITIKADGLPKPIKTDIPTDKTTGKPRWFFRERTWVEKFIRCHRLNPGDTVTINRIEERTYNVSPNNNHPQLVETDYKTTKSKTSTEFYAAPKTLEKLLDIGYTRTCNCPKNHINCLTAKNWVRNQVAIWELYYEKRDIRNKDIHPAVFPIALPRRCIELFTHRGELVLDPFMGIGTTLIAARDSARNAIGLDLNRKYVDFSNERLSQLEMDFGDKTKQYAICDDALNISKYVKKNTVSLSVTSPPYANMLNRKRLHKSTRGNLRVDKHYKKNLQYSNNPRDLGTMKPKEYAEALAEIYKEILPLLKPKAHCVINVNDLWENNHRYPIHSYIIEALEKVGYELRNIIIWDKRNLVNKVGIFGWPSNYITLTITFEYILDFWRPL